MRKAYKKARWKKLAERVRKRGGFIVFGFKTVKDVSAPDFPFTFEGLQMAVEYLKKQAEGDPDGRYREGYQRSRNGI